MPRFVYSNSYGQENSFRRESNDIFENANLAPCISPNGRNYSNVKIQKQNIKFFDPRQPNFQAVRNHNLNQNNVAPCIQLNSPRNFCFPSN